MLAVRNSGELGDVVQFNRAEVISTLRRTAFAQAADDAARVLPDPIDPSRLAEFCELYGITESELINQMGGSP